MKLFVVQLVIIVAFGLLSLAHGQHATTNGKPSCQTKEELKTHVFRDYDDPIHYWECVAFNQSVHRQCPDQQGYMDSVKACVDWSEWQWEVPPQPVEDPAKAEN